MLTPSEAKALIFEQLSPKRFTHSENVAKMAVHLAKRYGVDPTDAEIAGLLHDYAKDLPEYALLRIAKDADLDLTGSLIDHPQLLHGPVAAYLLESKGLIQNEEILQAIALHTLGNTKMNPLSRIIYAADYIEPGRRLNDDIRCGIQKAQEEGLDALVFFVNTQTIRWLLKKETYIHPDAIALYNELLPLQKESEAKFVRKKHN